MSNDWVSYYLDELCDFVNGYAFKSTDYVPHTRDTIEVFRMGYISRGGGFKEDDSPVFVPNDYGKDLGRFLLREGDIAMAMTDMKDRVAILGNTAWIRDSARFVLNQRVGCLRVRRPDLLDPRFLYFYTNWIPYVEHLRSRANSGVQVNLSTSAIKESIVTVPPLAEQKRIAHILGTLDDKIELNRRMNETLEQMARAIFKSWFVDFDPVRAKAEGRQPYGMDADTAALFPDSFADSALGKIPKGWEVSRIGDVVTIVGGGTPSTAQPSYWDGTYAFATPKDLSPLQFPVLQSTERRITEAGLKQIGSGLLPLGTMLLSSRAPIGYTAITTIPVAVNQGFIAMKCDGVLPNHYVLLWTQNNLDTIIGNANGTTFLEISKRNFKPIRALTPTQDILEAFNKAASLHYTAIAVRLQESKQLTRMRDELLSGFFKIG